MSESAGAIVTRRFAALPESVFDAWVTPASFADWWGVGSGIPDFHFYGEYIVVERPNKLVMTFTDEPGDARELLTVTFTAVDGGTGVSPDRWQLVGRGVRRNDRRLADQLRRTGQDSRDLVTRAQSGVSSNASGFRCASICPDTIVGACTSNSHG